jgi:hypothetical protein
LRPVRTNWKDHRNDKIIGNCGGCKTHRLAPLRRWQLLHLMTCWMGSLIPAPSAQADAV